MARIEVTFRVLADVEHGYFIGVVGDSPELGAWNVSKCLLLSTDAVRHPWWSSPPTSLALPGRSGRIEYKYVKLNGVEFECWESVLGNRFIETQEGSETKVTTSDFFNLKSSMYVMPSGLDRFIRSQADLTSSSGLALMLSQIDSLASLIATLANTDQTELEPLKARLSQASSTDEESQLRLLSEYLSYSLERSHSIRPEVDLVFEVTADTNFGEHIAVVGNIRELGSWDPKWSFPLRTSDVDYPVWHSNPLKLKLLSVPFNLEFKYIKMKEDAYLASENFIGNREIRVLGGSNFNVKTVDDIHKRSVLTLTSGEGRAIVSTAEAHEEDRLTLLSFIDQVAKLLGDASSARPDILEGLRAALEHQLSRPKAELKGVLQQYLCYALRQSTRLAGLPQALADNRELEIAATLRKAKADSISEVQAFREVVGRHLEGKSSQSVSSCPALEYSVDSALKALLAAPKSVLPESSSRSAAEELVSIVSSDPSALVTKVETIEGLAYSLTDPCSTQELMEMLEKSNKTSQLFWKYSPDETQELQELSTEYSQVARQPSIATVVSTLHKHIHYNWKKMERFSCFEDEEIEEVIEELRRRKRRKEDTSPSTAGEADDGNLEGLVEASDQTAQLLVGMTEARENELTQLRSVKIVMKERLEKLVLLNLKLVGQLADCSQETEELVESITHRRFKPEDSKPLPLRAASRPLRPDYVNLNNEANLALRHVVELTKTNPLTSLHEDALELSSQELSSSKPLEQISQKVALIKQLQGSMDYSRLVKQSDETAAYLTDILKEGGESHDELKGLTGFLALCKLIEFNRLQASKLSFQSQEEEETEVVSSSVVKSVPKQALKAVNKPKPSAPRAQDDEPRLDQGGSQDQPELQEFLGKYIEQQLRIDSLLAQATETNPPEIEELRSQFQAAPRDHQKNLAVFDTLMTTGERLAEQLAAYEDKYAEEEDKEEVVTTSLIARGEKPKDLSFIVEAVRGLRGKIAETSPSFVKSFESLAKLSGLKVEDHRPNDLAERELTVDSIPSDLGDFGEYITRVSVVIKGLLTKLQKYHIDRVQNEHTFQDEAEAKLAETEGLLTENPDQRKLFRVLSDNLKLSEPFQDDSLQSLISKRTNRQHTLVGISQLAAELKGSSSDDEITKMLRETEIEAGSVEEESGSTLRKLANFFEVDATVPEREVEHCFTPVELIGSLRKGLGRLRALEGKKDALLSEAGLAEDLTSLWRELQTASSGDLKATTPILTKLVSILGTQDDKQQISSLQPVSSLEPAGLKEVLGGLKRLVATNFSNRDTTRAVEERLANKLTEIGEVSEDLDEKTGELLRKATNEVSASAPKKDEEAKEKVRQLKAKASEADDMEDSFGGKLLRSRLRVGLLEETEPLRKAYREKLSSTVLSSKHQLMAKDEEIEALKNSGGNSEFADKVEALTKENTEVQDQLAAAVKDVAEKDSEIGRLRGEKEGLTQKTEESQLELGRLNEECEENQKEIKKLRKKCKDSESKLKEALGELEAKSNVDAADSGSSGLSDKIESLRFEVSNLKSALDQREQEYSALSSEKATTERRYTQLQKELEEERKLHEATKHDLSASKSSQLKSKLVTKTNILDQSAENMRLKAQLDASQTELERTLSSHEIPEEESKEEGSSTSISTYSRTETVEERSGSDEEEVVKTTKKSRRAARGVRRR
jgi:hypothetical protein